MSSKQSYYHWSEKETDHILKNYPRLSSGQIAIQLGIDVKKVKAKIYGLKRQGRLSGNHQWWKQFGGVNVEQCQAALNEKIKAYQEYRGLYDNYISMGGTFRLQEKRRPLEQYENDIKALKDQLNNSGLMPLTQEV